MPSGRDWQSNTPAGALAHLGLARAYALQGVTAELPTEVQASARVSETGSGGKELNHHLAAMRLQVEKAIPPLVLWPSFQWPMSSPSKLTSIHSGHADVSPEWAIAPIRSSEVRSLQSLPLGPPGSRPGPGNKDRKAVEGLAPCRRSFLLALPRSCLPCGGLLAPNL